MALVAPLSKYKKNTFLVWMVVLAGFGAYCIYDGYYNETFRAKHTGADGKPDATLIWNQKWLPIFCGGSAVLLGAYLLVIRNRKIVADDAGLVINGKINIAYDSIQKIDKTHFDSKGHFTLTYKSADGREINCKITDKDYDGLGPVLNHLVTKIS